MERLTYVERGKNIVSIGILALALSACIVPENTQAYTTPIGITYLVDNPSQELIDHEECHYERGQEEGLPFWMKYATDEEFRCEEETRCGIPDHLYCKVLDNYGETNNAERVSFTRNP